MTILSRRHRLFTLGLVLATCAAFLAAMHAGAKAGQSEERMTSYRTPIGIEMSPEAATSLVVDRFGRENGRNVGALKVTTVRATSAQAAAVADGRRVSEALYGGPPDIAEMRLSSSYIVVMEASAGSEFTPNVSVPRGHAAPSGAVETIVVDAHTGRKEGLSLEPTLPPGLSELAGPILRTSFPAVSSSASSAGAPLGNVGRLVGHVYAGKRALVGHRVVVGHSPLSHRIVQAGRTFAHGLFTFRLAPGDYRVAARKRNGKMCGSRIVRIARHQETEVALHC
jgi:hypothetical protein